MRTLVLLRGCPGTGKSTWIRDHQLNQYTLSADQLRLIHQTPVLNLEGKYDISQKNDGKVWKLLFSLLEERMERGEFTIVDATHAKQSMISGYKALVLKYRYRAYVVDFSDIPLETALLRNRERIEHKRVPDSVVHAMHERILSEPAPSWTTVIKPEEFDDVMQYKPRRLDSYKKIHVIGDVHGCFTVLDSYLKGRLEDDELYIFTGDMLDRGIENAKVVQFLLSIKDRKNVVLLEGNHDKYLKQYGHDEETRSSVFNKKTKPELDEAGFDKKDIRELARRFHQIVYFTYGEDTYIITHGGISALPDNLLFTATSQLINGVGGYETDIDHVFTKNMEGRNIIQIHGHRNMFRLPVHAAAKSYNLEGQVEHGGHLRVVTIDRSGIQTHEIKNEVFKTSAPPLTSHHEHEELTVEHFLKHLDEHDYVSEQKLAGGISSFNFTRKAFQERKWDSVSMKARGLFINRNTNEIVSRSYNKFFNIDERLMTKMHVLVNTLRFPVTVYDKANGFLGTVGYNSETDELVFTSKSYTSASGQKDGHAKWVEELFHKTFDASQIEDIKEYVKKRNVSLVFEVVLPEKDPHIIEYKSDKLVLLDIVKRQMKYEKLPYEDVVRFAETYRVECKQKVIAFHQWTDFYKWYLSVSNNPSIEEEGYVIEDSAGFMTKLKLPFYQYWKFVRKIKHRLGAAAARSSQHDALFHSEHVKFLAWAKTKDSEYFKNQSVIAIRNDFYSET
ncbi:metallophosphoesterase [Bacillus haynesii]|uniref:RNA ligase n=1 Tax=Bacillus haynesii TaxID=1925021 RepID=UPI002282273D|nr:RNA ligase [Bacillus haynesii]MCY7965794.1 metallophosphoesterase [Bacillus haynesii]MCY7993606.1 metallophosphoesterase [Bacillus haynesii]MCY8548586.1 metallophosphoesterase [Bacillus haynesii]MCY8572434.1 metallophosphoesterase [Bacillus haynesii]MCY9214136.1 metallophosphoesterase [Bacillus haynesii]